METFIEHFWFILGILFIVLEFILPGLISVFVGMSSLTVYALFKAEIIDSFFQGLAIFFLSSIVYLLVFRTAIQKFIPSSFRKQNMNEDIDADGDEVVVIENINAGETGRILYRETTWQAKAVAENSFKEGDNAYICGRDNLTWKITKKGGC